MQNSMAAPAHAAAVNVPSHILLAAVTLVLFPLAGVMSVYYARQVNLLLAAGDIAGARAASGKAKVWALVGFGVVAVFLLFCLLAVGAYLLFIASHRAH